MLRFFVATLLATLLTISHSPAAPKSTPALGITIGKSIPAIATEIMRTKYILDRIERIERFKAENPRINSQQVHVYTPAPSYNQQNPTWKEYREIVEMLRETQLVLATLQVEIANLKARPSEKIVKKKVAPARQPRASRKHKSTSRNDTRQYRAIADTVRRRLYGIDIPTDIIYDVAEAKRKTPDKSSAVIVHDIIFEHPKLSYARKLDCGSVILLANNLHNKPTGYPHTCGLFLPILLSHTPKCAIIPVVYGNEPIFNLGG